MSKPNSQTTTHIKEPLTPAQLARMATIPCNKGDNCEHHMRRNCRYLHEERKVQHDPRSHKQLLAQETDEEVLKRVLLIQGFSTTSSKYIIETMSLQFILALLEMNSSFQKLIKSSAITGSAIVEILNNFLRTCEQFPDKLQKLKSFLAKNIQTFSLNQRIDEADLQASINDFLGIFAVPEQVQTILKSHQEAKALRESKDPVERARANPNCRPEPEFLNHLKNALGLYRNHGFEESLRTHDALGSTSPYLNRHFLEFLSIHEAKKSAEKLLREKELMDERERMLAEAQSELLRECLTNHNPNMRIAFNLLKSLPVFQSFVRSLTRDQSEILITVFGPFLSCLAISLKQETMITCELLSSLFKTYCDLRKVGDDAECFKEAFFKSANTQIFENLFGLFQLKTQAYHAPKSGKLPASIDVGELMKFMLKELLPLYEDKVPSEERDNFRMELIKHLLPFAFVVSLRPNHANMIAARWKYGKKDSNGQEVNAFLEMQKEGSKKSILYWLMSILNQNKDKSRKRQVVCDSFEQLSSKFTERVEVMTDKGITETKTVFSPQFLFSALDDILLLNFIGSREFGLPIASINQEALRGIFEKSEDSIVLHRSFPEVLLKAIYYALGCDERNPLTRQFSDMRSVFSMNKDVLLQGVDLCTQFKSSEDKMCIIRMLISHLGFKNACSSLETPLLNLMTLLSENKSPDLLRKVYDVMSLATMIIDSTEWNGRKNESYFMSIIDALVVVLLKEKFPTVKQLTIVNAVYDAKGVYGIPCGVLKPWMETLSDSDQRKLILSQFLNENVSADKKTVEEITKVVASISTGRNMANCLFCHVRMEDGSFHDLFKRILPFLLSEKSLRSLSQTSTEFEMEPVESLISADFSAILSDKLRAGFETLLSTFLSSQSFKIQWDLKNRMEEIAKSESLSSRLVSLRFTKHLSAIINLLNSLFEILSLEYRLSNDTLADQFPSTFKLSPEESAHLVSLHVMKVLGIVEPVKPVKPVEPDASLDKKPDSKSKNKSKKKSASASASSSSAPIQDEVVAVDKKEEQNPSPLTHEEYIAQKSMFDMMWNLVFHAVSTIYRVKLTSEDVKEQTKKVDTFTVSSLKQPFSEANSLNDLFSLCLPCWKSQSVRELILPILDHFFKSGNVLVRQLYSHLQRYGVVFEEAETSSYEGLFEFLANPNAVFSKNDKYENSDDEMLTQLKPTIEFFSDDTREVQLSKPIIERRPLSLRKRVAPLVDSGLASGGGPAPERVVESCSEEEAPTRVDKQTLLDHLGKSKKDAIAYLELCNRDEIDESVLDYLKSDDFQLEEALSAINEQYV